MTARLRSSPISIPAMADPIMVTATIPMITPRAVSMERILCARMTLKAMRKASTISWIMRSSNLEPRASSFPRLLHGHLRPILELPGNRGIAPRHHLIAGLDSALDLDVRVVGEAGLHLLHLHVIARLDEDHALQLLAQLAGLLFLQRLVGDVGAIVPSFRG